MYDIEIVIDDFLVNFFNCVIVVVFCVMVILFGWCIGKFLDKIEYVIV